MKLKKVVIAVNQLNKDHDKAQDFISECLDKSTIKYCIIPVRFEKNGSTNRFQSELLPVCEESDLLVIIGGDGTILTTVKTVIKADIPVLGINTGKVGFLTEFNYKQIKGVFSELINNKFRVSKRQILETEVEYCNKKEIFYSLNDFIISRGSSVFKVINYKVKIDGAAAINFYGDGIIIATPTGSTAYNLSAGGPIMYPEGNGLMITPICSHSLLIKPFIISNNQSITLESKEFSKTIFSADGLQSPNISGIKRIKFKVSDKNFKLLVHQKYNFFKLLFSKLK